MDFFLKGLAYDLGLKFQISSEFLYSQIGPRNHVWWCFRVKWKWFWRYMRMSDLISRHLGFFPKGLAYDCRSKFEISFRFVYSQIEPKNNICWCLRVKLRWFWRYMKMSNLISRHLGFFLKGLACDFGTKFQISSEFL